ncbi:hypothetical protein C2E23DRAFT_900534 [Lenzites betulinus]|nr:hypothetical protein C2E23DRAFT_900534 [Lenzites betulinus]
MVRRTTIRDRAYAQLRRSGSGSFTLDQMTKNVSADYHKNGIAPPKQVNFYVTDSIHRLAQEGYVVRRPGDPRRFKPQPKLNVITRRSKRLLAPDAHPKTVADFYMMSTGKLKPVPKRELYCMFLNQAEEIEARGEGLAGALVQRANAEVRASEGHPSAPSARGAGRSQGAPDTHMEVDENENPFLDSDAGAVSSGLPATPQRVQHFGSYPTPPSTVLPPARQLSAASVGRGSSAGASAGDVATRASPLRRAPTPFNHAYDVRKSSDPPLRTLTSVIAQPQLDADTTEDPEREDVRGRIVVLSAENEVLTGERDLYRKKHFVTAVALKGSQLQVEKRDKDAASLVSNIARSLGLSRWAPQAWL